MRLRARTDANQGDILDALRQVGAEVRSVAALGSGMGDLLVAFRRRLFLLEVKTTRGKLTADQMTFHKRWPVAIVRTVDDALDAIGARR
jgi:hypothetical protein